MTSTKKDKNCVMSLLEGRETIYVKGTSCNKDVHERSEVWHQKGKKGRKITGAVPEEEDKRYIEQKGQKHDRGKKDKRYKVNDKKMTKKASKRGQTDKRK